MRPLHLLLLAAGIAAAGAAERKFDFGDTPAGRTPPGFRSVVAGEGKPGEWSVVMDAVPPLMQPLTTRAAQVTARPVLAQLAEDRTDEHFPMLVYDNEKFGDFTLTTLFKTVRGAVEQMAGIAFRIENETNYYVVRASSLGSTFRFYKVADGVRGPPVGPEIVVSTNVWHELALECKGIQIRCLLDGKELISVSDKVNPFLNGKFAFWTKSDSVSYFADTRIVYTPHEPPAQTMVRDLGKRYPRLLGLKVFAAGKEANSTRVIASRDQADLGQAGGTLEWDVLQQGATYYGKDKEKGSVSVTMPLRDRNGDVVAAVRVVMKSFPGQTEQNAIVRAAPVVKDLQARVQSLQDLLE